MKKRIKVVQKRLIADVSPEMHHTIKTRALKKKLTIREWVLLAITELINKEMIEEI